MFNNILRVGLYLSLVLCFPYWQRLDAEEVTAGFIIFLLIAASFITKPKRSVNLKPLTAAFVVAVAVSAITHHFPTWRMLSNLTLGVVLIKIIAERFDFEYKSIGKILFIYAIVSNVIIVTQLITSPTLPPNMRMFRDSFDTIYSLLFDTVSGVSILPWVMGVSGILCMPFIFAWKKKAVIALLPMVYFSDSIACVVLFLGALSYLLGMWRLNVIAHTAVILGVLTVLYFLLVEKTFDIDRVQAWVKSLEYGYNPVIGKGFGTWAHQGFIKHNGAVVYHWRWAHNEFFQHFYETGLVGLTFLILWVKSLFNNKDKIAKAAVGLLVLECMFHPVLHWPRLTILSIFIIAIAEGATRKRVLYGI